MSREISKLRSRLNQWVDKPQGKTIMKSLKSYLLIAVVSLSTLLVPSAFANAAAPVRGIDVIVKKGFCSTCSSRQMATANADGTFSVNLPASGNYTITYASGPHKGEVITSVTATKRQHSAIRIPRSGVETSGATKTTTSATGPAKSETRDLKRDTKVQAAGTTVKPRPSHSVSPEASAAPKP